MARTCAEGCSGNDHFPPIGKLAPFETNKGVNPTPILPEISGRLCLTPSIKSVIHIRRPLVKPFKVPTIDWAREVIPEGLCIASWTGVVAAIIDMPLGTDPVRMFLGRTISRRSFASATRESESSAAPDWQASMMSTTRRAGIFLRASTSIAVLIPVSSSDCELSARKSTGSK